MRSVTDKGDTDGVGGIERVRLVEGGHSKAAATRDRPECGGTLPVSIPSRVDFPSPLRPYDADAGAFVDAHGDRSNTTCVGYSR